MLKYLWLYAVFLSPILAYAESANDEHQHKPSAGFDEKADLKFSQDAIGKTVGEYSFTNTLGNSVKMSDFRGKPLVVSMIYTSCYHICPTTTRHLASVVDKARKAFGDDSFNVLTIGFDSRNDTPDAMRVFAAQQAVDMDNWQFLSADMHTIRSLSEDIGFRFYASPHGFDHLIQATVIDGKGIVYRQVYDMTFHTPLLTEPVKELLENRPVRGGLLSHLGDKIRLFCTVYDPANDRYYVDYSIFIGLVIGLSSLGLVLLMVVREWRKNRTTAA